VDAGRPGDIDAGEILRRVVRHPLRQQVPASLLDERQRVGFVDRIEEEQRHQIFQTVDPGDVMGLGLRLEAAQLRQQFFEAALGRGELERLDVRRRHGEELVPAALEDRRDVVLLQRAVIMAVADRVHVASPSR
jgi:hypothetical protein